jgi:hypothetical protein
LRAPYSPDDASVRFALAWLAFYFMLIARALAAEREAILLPLERLLQAVSALLR